MTVTFSNRVPGTKSSVGLKISALSQSTKTLVIIGHLSVAGGTVAAGVPQIIENFGNPDDAKTECDGYFGADSEIGEMVVAAINSILYTNSDNEGKNIEFPVLKCIPMANGDDDLEAFLGKLLTVPMPHVVVPYDITDDTSRAALKDHLVAISGQGRGVHQQYGSFGYMGAFGELATVSPLAIAEATQVLSFPWLRDTAAGKANKLHEVAAAYAAICAGNAYPFNPVNDVKLGKVDPPSQVDDYHTGGDAGTVALGLAAGLVPLMVNAAGEVVISRSITALRSNEASPDAAYYDIQDWQVLYEYRYQAHVISQRQEFTNKKRTTDRTKELRTALIKRARDMQDDEALQHVDELVDQFTITIPKDNRHAAIYKTPLNVVPGFHQKGIDVIGTDEFDVFEL